MHALARKRASRNQTQHAGAGQSNLAVRRKMRLTVASVGIWIIPWGTRNPRADRPHPGPDDPGMPPGRDVRGPDSDIRLGKRYCSGFRCAVASKAASDLTALDDVVHAETDQIAAAPFAVDGEIEWCKFSGPMVQLQSNPDGPDLFKLQWRLPAKQLDLVPRRCTSLELRDRVHERLLRDWEGASF